MTMGSNFAKLRVVWTETADTRFPYAAQVDGKRWTLRVNDWPDEPSLYTLFIGKRPVLELEEWPSAWIRPRHGS